MLNLMNPNNFLFWQKWLFISSLIFAFAGIIFAFSGVNFLFLPYDEMLAKVFWDQTAFPIDVIPFRTFIYGPLGGTIACCYTLLAFIAYYPFKEKQIWARNAVVVAFSIWAIIDSAVCIQFGVYQQIYFINAFSVAVKALPIIFTWKHFLKKKNSE